MSHILNAKTDIIPWQIFLIIVIVQFLNIDPCLFNEISETRAKRSYTLDWNSTWRVKCNNTKIFTTTCSEDGHWGTDVACTVTSKNKELLSF